LFLSENKLAKFGVSFGAEKATVKHHASHAFHHNFTTFSP
jgi:hypothetical protein